MSQIGAPAHLSGWAESAQYWERHSGFIQSVFQPISESIIRATLLKPGLSVLDVAGGSGEPSLTISRHLGQSGSVTCTDAAAGMVQAARRRAESDGRSNIGFAECLAESLPFNSSAFDLVVCRLGLMHFENPAAAISEMARVVRPRGRICLAVWHEPDRNPYLAIPAKIVADHMGPDLTPSDAPGAFRFSTSGAAAKLLRDQGLVDLTEELLRFELKAPVTIDEFWEVRSEMSESLRTKLKSAPPEIAAAIATAVKQAAKPFFSSGQMSFPAEVLVVSGLKSKTAAG